MTSRIDELSPRARWFLENFDEIDLADICASNEAAAERLRQGIADVITDMHATTGARHWIAALDRLLQPPECDHDSQVIDHEGAQYWACLKCGRNLGRVDAPDGGPTVAEAAADDKRWPLEKAGE